MIAKHLVQTNHLFEADNGAELYIEIDQVGNTAVITYRLDKDHAKTTIETDSFGSLVDLLNEAAKLITPVAQG